MPIETLRSRGAIYTFHKDEEIGISRPDTQNMSLEFNLKRDLSGVTNGTLPGLGPYCLTKDKRKEPLQNYAKLCGMG